ncbi:hypothetical protein [Amycolatopsis sp. CFH S0078]|uniref:hypothetical protein n=1 Tax=Amycolatopsis sp. CFH S0078 TaxID=1644108 RepID=UPI00106EEA5D|nr:hypothetical protein [Amycolatopsis sp. CFH S0078]
MSWLVEYAPVAGVVVAVSSVIAASLSGRLAWKSFKTARDDREHHHASRFAVWWSPEGKKVVYHNAGDMPVFDVVITVNVGGQLVYRRPRTLDPTKELRELKDITRICRRQVTKCVNEMYADDIPAQPDLLELAEEEAIAEARAESWFRDVSGAVWHRDFSGTLEKADEKEYLKAKSDAEEYCLELLRNRE